ncbi:MAG: class I tRNA ligase family protein, partial [Opitutaceae bacterium]
EGSDQHRGWFQSSLWTSMIAQGGRAPYRAVLTHGFIVDEDRRKISKSSTYEKPQTSEAYVSSHGGDVIRLWIASQDFRDDLPISGEILAHVGETYKLLRNTFRYQLANLFDFDPESDAVPVPQLDTLDRWVLHRTAELVRACAQAYDAFEFHRVYQLCNHFCSVTLSATYHDILKDRLYTLATRHPLRRSSQTALHHVLHSLARIVAPVLVFTADEAWSYAVAKQDFTDGSVHLQDWPEPPASWTDPALSAEADALLQIRAKVNEAIEPLRAAGRLGKSLDATVAISGDPASPAARILERHRDLLAELFIVSHVSLQFAADRSAAGGSPTLEISVRPSAESGACRCARCWRWVPALESTDRGEVCPRCREALAGAS